VVEARVSGEIIEGTGGAGFRVRSSVDQTAYACGVEGAGTHGTGFEGSVEGAVGESPATRAGGGATEGEEFGMGGGVFRGLALVVGHCQDFLSPHYHGSDGDFAAFGGPRGLSEGAVHHREVPCGSGARLG